MSVYTRRLFAGLVPVPNAFTLIYRAPPTGTTVIRDIIFVNAGTQTAGNLGLQLTPMTRALPAIIFWTSGLTTGTTHLDLRQAMEPNDQLEVYATTNELIYVAVTGYVFA